MKADPKDVRLALRYIERSATTGLAELEASTPATRDAIVVKIALEVMHASEAIVDLLDGLAVEKRSDLRPAANAAVEALNQVGGWISLRAPNAEMLTTFDAAVRELEPALQTMKVEAIAIRGQPVFKNSEVREGNDERAEVHEAASALLAALDAENDLLLIGIGTFADLAAIDDSKPPPFIETLAKSLVVAAAGHLIGEAMGALLQHSTKAPQSPPLA